MAEGVEVALSRKINNLRLKTPLNGLIEAVEEFSKSENGVHEFSEHLMPALSLCIFDRSGRVSASPL